MTLLEIVNKVLIKLRKPQVASVDANDYSALIGQLVNESRREVEDAWQWLALRSTITIVTTPDVSRYSFSAVGNARFKIMDVVNDTHDFPMRPANSTELTYKFLSSDPTDRGTPQFYGFSGFDSSGDPVVDIFPIPEDAQTIRFNLVIPQNDFDNGTLSIKVPGHIVVLGAYVKALVERGEDNTSGYAAASAQYDGALGAAISQEEALLPAETDWTPV